MQEDKECACGALYKVKKFKTIARDKDSYKCNECGRTLMEWNGGAMYIFTKIEKPE